MNDRAVRPKEAENCFRAAQLLERAMVMGMGACVASLIVCAFPCCGPAAEPLSSTPVVLSQIIEVNPTPPIEQNPSPPIEQNPSPPIESDPKPSIEENPAPPTEEQSMRPTAGAGKVLVTHQRGHWHFNVAGVTG